jgi:arylsulfatase A-like enzyme
LVAVALAGGLTPPSAPTGRPNVLIVTLDTVRADHCSVYGYGRATTPALEAVAAAGVVFEDAYAPMATTAPAHASLFTGLVPARHGVVKNGYVLPSEFETLAETLAAAGYDTAAIVSSFAVHGSFGLRQGFGHYDDEFAGNHTRRRHWEARLYEGAFDRDARPTTARSVHWLRAERDRTQPFLLWVHYYDPHHPWEPAPPFDRLFPTPAAGDDLAAAVARYDAEIRETDASIAHLLAELQRQGLAASTIVVVAGDHGEGLMDHDWMHHGLQLYEESVRVPLLVRWPGRIPPGRRLAAPVQLADVTPTVLDLVGVRPAAPAPAHPDAARSLAPALLGAEPLPAARAIFLQRRRYDAPTRGTIPSRGDKLGVRRGRWKYLEAPAEDSYELYDLASDPGETRNLIAERPEIRRRMAKRLHDWRRTIDTPPASGPVSVPNAARLQALGYVD